ncbi:DUF6907 domain-containing protein [Nocardioides mesophilus]|uniref:Uncharacterized protein n=1 Tax=Nocardioides mesophilus TaxID=433659 RepID=A0A7G9RC14_9ACTN|nr:hypothetical protein [Nocardioides mesophilus]QNN53139.1 hypothetical protein H9L09_01160 [Nocardioides mesophilus]
MRPSSRRRTPSCPTWCVLRHGQAGEDDTVHVSGALLVRRTVLRLCTTIDPGTRAQDGPYVLVGDEEYTLHEAEVLIAALTQLADQAGGVRPLPAEATAPAASLIPEQVERALPVFDA